MCLEDVLSSLASRHTLSRRRLFGVGAATGLGAAAVDGSRSPLLPALAQGAQPAPAGGGPGSAGVNFRWLGTAGWEISFGSKTILLDPWLTRTVTGALSGRPPDLTVSTTPNEALLDQHIHRADLILISHGHYDHIPDIPYLAAKTGALVLGTETHVNQLRALGVPDQQLGLVKGGESLRFDGFAIEVFPSLHSLNRVVRGATRMPPLPGRITTVPPPPTRVADFPEGDTLAYQLTVGGTYRIFLMGTANFIERAISGLEPDAALVATSNFTQTDQFTPRLLRALNYPRLILPTHWDNWEQPFTTTEVPRDLREVTGDDGNLDLWLGEARQVAPRSQFVVMKYLESFAP